MYNTSLVPCDCLNGRPIFKYIYLPKQASTEKVWSTIRMNTLLVEIWFQYKLWIFKIQCPSPICLFFSLESFTLSREPCFSCIHKNDCWYHDWSLRIGWLVYFWRWTTLRQRQRQTSDRVRCRAVAKLNINMRWNIFSSLHATINYSTCPKHNVAICMQLLNLKVWTLADLALQHRSYSHH